jgi:predicted GIY-YIG superfamily endonuclease
MNATPKTIQIFLPSGDPQGIRIAEITTRIVQMIEVPRSLLQDFLTMPESNKVAVYFLFGEEEDGADTKVYIGQTGDLCARLVSHNKEKGFWERALVLVSLTNSLTQTHALFLEWHCLQAARKAGRYPDLNGNSGIKPHTPAPLQADCIEIFETGQTLLATLGYPVFDSVAKSVASSNPVETFYCKAAGAEGRGLYTPEGFVVLKGSRGHAQNAATINASYKQLRATLIAAGVMHVDGDQVVFDKDHLFSAPSAAAVAVLGRNANGWTEWKTKAGVTLDTLKRVLPAETS